MKTSRYSYLLFGLFLLGFSSIFNPLQAQDVQPTPNAQLLPTPTKPATKPLKIVIPAAPTLDASAYMIIDVDSGQELVAQNVDQRLEPASLTKMMTAYVVDRALTDGKITLTQLAPISEKAWRMEGSRMFVQVNTKVPVDDLLKGVIIQSGNDASVALAEFVAGSEDSFADLMNQEAARLGMTQTHFVNATGLPDPNHYTTARDLAILARAIVKDFPETYHYYSEKWFTYNNIRQANRNLLLWRDPSVDGIKTGHTETAGYCLVSSAKRDNMRLITVIMGAKSSNARAEQSASLLTYGFRFYETHQVFAANKPLAEPRIWMGNTEKLALGLTDDLYLTIPKNRYKDLKAELQLLNGELKAPAITAHPYGQLLVTLDGDVLADRPLVALHDVERGGIWRRISDYTRLSIRHVLNKKEAADDAHQQTKTLEVSGQ